MQDAGVDAGGSAWRDWCPRGERPDKRCCPRLTGPATARRWSVGVVVRVVFAAVALAGVPGGMVSAQAQTLNPVYMDDSTRARDALGGLEALIAAGNTTEAVRTLQDLLETEGSRVVESAEDADLFMDVRARVESFIAARPELLRAYRDAQEADARRLVDAGRVGDAERTRWLTRAGLEAALRVAQGDLSAGRFESARLGLWRAERHPDASDAGLARAAAVLADLVWRYLPRQDVGALAGRWSVRAGRGPESGRPVAWPVWASAAVVNPVLPQAGLDVQALDNRPQAAVRLAPDSARPEGDDSRDPRVATSQLPWVMPAVVGDTVLVNDGEYLSAWDRFTLSMRWRLRPPVPEEARESIQFISGINSRHLISQGLEDASFVVAAQGYALATTGLARMGAREGDDRVHAVEIQSGRLLWSVDVNGLDPSLALGSIRGPALVDGTTVVLAVRTYQQFRRLQAVAMVGLDLHTGSTRWVRSVASAGTLPYRRPTAVADLGIVHEGVVYRVDELGTIVALEASTGRPVWIRRMLSFSGPEASGEPWAMSAPIIDGTTLVALSPDHREVLRLDLATGRVVGRRGADVMGWPRYLLRCGEHLVAVGVARIAVTPLARFEQGEVLYTPQLPVPVIGRVVVSGDRLLVPCGAGVSVVDPALPGKAFNEQNTIALGQRGMILAAESQLLVCDNDRLRSYLVWAEALARLREMVEKSPGDPAPALTLSRLASRAGEWDLLVANVNLCLNVLERGGVNEAPTARDELFRFVLGLVRLARAPSTDPGVQVPPPAIVEALVARLSRAARTPEQRAGSLMEEGELLARTGRAREACAAYQRVLDQPGLADVMWGEGVLSVPAGLEAARRVRGLVGTSGLGVYQSFDASAEMERRALGSAPKAEDLERLARRFPAARGAASLWLDVARWRQEQGLVVERLEALRSAVECATARARAGEGLEPSGLAAAGGALVLGLESVGERAWARSALDELLAEFPGLEGQIRDGIGGVAIDAGTLRARLAADADAPPARARTFGRVATEPRVLGGRRVAPVLVGPAPTDRVVLVSDDSRRLELWVAGTEGLVQSWEKEFAGDMPPTVISHDATRLLLGTRGREGLVVECLDPTTGTLRWRTPAFDTLFPPDPDLQARLAASRQSGATILTPLDGLVRADDMLVTHDGRTLVLAERSGRVATLDLRDGRALWARRLAQTQVHDLAVRGTRLAVAGAFPHPVGPESVQTTLGPALDILDARTGSPIARHDDARAPDDPFSLGEVRWVRLSPSGGVVAGLRLGVGMFDAHSGTLRWRADGGATSNALDSWIDGQRLWILGADRGLRQVSLADGVVRVGALPTQGRTGSRSRIALTRLDRGVALTSGLGVVLLDPEGGLLGVDAIDRRDTLLPPAVGIDHVAMVDSVPRRRGNGEPAHRLTLVNTVSAREVASMDLLLPGEPTGVALVDGHILVTTRAGVVVLRME